jgi:hypothetical protein
MMQDPRDVFTESEYEFGGLILAPCRHLVVLLKRKNGYPRDAYLHLGDVPHWMEVDGLVPWPDPGLVRDAVLERLGHQCLARPIPTSDPLASLPAR